MIRVLCSLVFWLLVFNWTPFAAQAIGQDRIDIVSGRSFEETVQRLQWSIGGHGLEIVTAMNYEEILRRKKDSSSHAVVFEVMRRDWARRLLDANPGSGLVLPVRLYAFENATGTTIVSYLRPGFLLESSDNATLREFSRHLDETMGAIVEEATSSHPEPVWGDK